jgi:methionyl aminopeptidase
MIIYLKTEDEIVGFKRVGKETARILQKLLDAVEVGITTKQLDKIAKQECKTIGAKPAFLNYRGFPAAICTSVNEILVHGIPNDKPLQDGDIISIDIGVDMDGFIGDTADTVIVGSSSTIMFDMITKCREALANAISMSRADNKLIDVNKAIYDIAKKNKYEVPIEYGGHGIDRGLLHTAPFVANKPVEDYNIRLRPGMIFAIEPMFIYGNDPKISVADDKWSVRANGLTAHCEHTVLITEDNPLILTKR